MQLIVSAASTDMLKCIEPMFDKAGYVVSDEQNIKEWGRGVKEKLNGHAFDLEESLLSDQAILTSAKQVIQNEGATNVIQIDDPAILPAYEVWQRILPNTKFLFFYVRPELTLVQAMMKNKNVNGVLEEWKKDANAIIETRRRNRSESFIFNFKDALEQPDVFASECSTRLKINIDAKYIVTEGSKDVEIYEIIATQLVGQDAELQTILNELEASSIPFPKVTAPKIIDCQKAYLDYRNLKNHSEIELEELRKDNEISVLQIKHAQEELENIFLLCQEEKELRLQVEEKLKDSQKLTTEMNSKLDELKGVQGELSRQKVDFSNAVVEKNNEIRKLNESILQKEDLIKGYVEELKEVEEANKESQYLMNEYLKELKESEDNVIEKETLLNQLHEKQRKYEKDLHSVNSKLSKARKELNQIKEEFNKTQEELSANSSLLVKVEAENLAKLKELSRLRGKIENIRTSTLWRLTGPIRIVGRTLKKSLRAFNRQT